MSKRKNVLDHFNDICPYYSKNEEASLLSHNLTYQLEVLGFEHGPPKKRKLEGTMVRIIPGNKGVKIVGKATFIDLKSCIPSPIVKSNILKTTPVLIKNSVTLAAFDAAKLPHITNTEPPPVSIPKPIDGSVVSARCIHNCAVHKQEPEKETDKKFKSGIDVAVQADIEVDYVKELEEIYNTLKNDNNIIAGIEREMESPNVKTFKQRLFQDLKECDKINSMGNLPLHMAVLDNNAKMVARYCNAMKIRQISINSANISMETPLQLAVTSKADYDIIDLLIKSYNADVEVRDLNGNSILHLAVQNSNPEIVDVLARVVEQKTMNDVNFEGVTPLIIAVEQGNIEKIEGLLKAGVNPNICDKKSGRTALFHAIENNDYETSSILLEYDAKTKIKNYFGTSPHEAMYEMDNISSELKSLILNYKKLRMKCRRPYKKVQKLYIA